jgi:putative ABC transport system permease protein
MNTLTLAVRLLWRDGRNGELTSLFLALLIAATGSTAVGIFADRLHRSMSTQAADFLAADMVVESPQPLPTEWRDEAARANLLHGYSAEFSSVLMEHDEILLAAIKAVDTAYPLRGKLRISGGDYGNETTITHGPPSGQAWVEKRVLSALHLQLGDILTVGEKPLQITQVLTYEPDKRGDLYSFSPRVMINAGDLAATHLLQPGSHVHYFLLFGGGKAEIGTFKRWLKPRLNPSQRLMDIYEDRPELGGALERAQRYLGLSSIAVVLLAGVAIAMATRRYCERHFDAAAIMRCLGCKQGKILRLYASQLLLLGVAANVAGCLLGWFGQETLFHMLHNLLPQRIANPSPMALLFGFSTGMMTLTGFALPPLLRLKRVAPLRVLRRDLEPLPVAAWVVYALALSVVAVLVWRYTEDWRLTAAILGTGLAALMFLSALLYVLLAACRRLLPKFRVSWRFALRGLLQDPRAGIGQIAAFSVTLTAMLLSYSVRTELLDNWQKQLPENAPNHFALNIFPDQINAFKTALEVQQIHGSHFYPVVRGRLVEIDGRPVQKIVSKDSQGEQATHRDLSLTWSADLPEDNTIVGGQWWPYDKVGLVSVEKKLADSLHLKLGDTLLFTIGSEQLSATVASFRKLDWDTMKPNFYMIFSPGTLNRYPSTYLTSFYLSEAQKNDLNNLVKQFPAITVLEVDQILRQLQTILRQLTAGIDAVLYFALMAGFTVLFAAVYASLDQRIYEGAVLRTLGANRKLLRAITRREFICLGLTAGILAWVMSQALLYTLYSRVLNLDFTPDFGMLAVVAPLAALSIGVAGAWGTRDVLRKAPLRVLGDI